MKYFNFEKVAGEAGISPEKLREIQERTRREFPRDEMMYELHVLRICMAVRDGYIKLDDAFRAEKAEQES